MTKSRLVLDIDTDVYKILEKRAKKEMLAIEQLCEDIIRRSVVSYKGKSKTTEDKVDDKFLSYFSRKKK
jgi:hypothetical protein